MQCSRKQAATGDGPGGVAKCLIELRQDTLMHASLTIWQSGGRAGCADRCGSWTRSKNEDSTVTARNHKCCVLLGCHESRVRRLNEPPWKSDHRGTLANARPYIDRSPRRRNCDSRPGPVQQNSLRGMEGTASLWPSPAKGFAFCLASTCGQSSSVPQESLPWRPRRW